MSVNVVNVDGELFHVDCAPHQGTSRRDVVASENDVCANCGKEFGDTDEDITKDAPPDDVDEEGNPLDPNRVNE